jgi:hypothetical protein
MSQSAKFDRNTAGKSVAAQSRISKTIQRCQAFEYAAVFEAPAGIAFFKQLRYGTFSRDRRDVFARYGQQASQYA